MMVYPFRCLSFQANNRFLTSFRFGSKETESKKGEKIKIVFAMLFLLV